MADSQDNLFADCVFAFITSRELPADQAEELSKALEDRGGEVRNIGTSVDTLDDITHIISETSDFPQYATARLHMIPVVTKSWITQSLIRQKLAQLRPFTPDPNLIFSHITISCADIPPGDKYAITGAVLAMGGIEASTVTKMTTHICALTVDHPKCQAALEKHPKCKIVLPHWFDDCLKLGKKIDEGPYLLPDPEIFRVNPEDPLPIPSTDRLNGATDHQPKDLLNLPGPSRRLDVFKGKRVMIDADLKIGVRLRAILEDLVETGRGYITNSVQKADMFVCQYREGRNYQLASQRGIDVGNLSWLYWMITNNEWTSPLRRLLHYPVPKNGIPGFESTRITLSNYGGEARTYLENLVLAAGGEFTKSMKQDNTHLVTARNSSEKCQAAAEWNIHMINHLWLEESFAKCELQNLTDRRYTHFPPRTNLGEIIGETQYDSRVLEKLYYPEDLPVSPDDMKTTKRPIMHEKDRNASTSKISAADPTNDKDQAVEATKVTVSQRRTKSAPEASVKTPVANRRISAGKENDTPSTGSRSAKDKAMSRLHGLAPDIALYEKERKRKGPVWGGERAANMLEQERMLERSSSPLSKREAEDEFSEEEEVRNPKRAKTSGLPPVEMRLMITGYKGWLGNITKEDADKKKLREMGILIVQDPHSCTHLAAPAVVRTQKFLCALAYGPVIVSANFIDSCLKKGDIADVNKFLLKDTENEHKFNVKLKDSLARAKANKRSLLRRVPIYCTENIPNGPSTYKSIVEANGGTFAVYRGRPVIKKISPEEDTDPAEPVYLVTGLKPEERKLWPKFIEMAEAGNMIPRIVQTEWLLDIAMSQKQKWNDSYSALNA